MRNKLGEQHAICRRADGSVEEIVCDIESTGGGGRCATNFRTLDGTPLVLHPKDQIEITYGLPHDD